MEPIYWIDLCGNASESDAFWSDSITWNSSTPDLTQCFQKTVLSWTPCMYLWVACLVYIPMLVCKTTVNRGISRFNLLKTVICGVLALLSVIDIAIVLYHQHHNYQLELADYLRPTLNLFTYLLLSVLMHYEYRKGVHSGGVVFIFWFITFTLNIVTFRTNIISAQCNTLLEKRLLPTFYIAFCVKFAQLIFHLFSDDNALPLIHTHEKSSSFAYQQFGTTETLCPAESAPFWQRFTFLWMTKLIIKGYRRTLTGADLWSLMPGERCEAIITNITESWNQEIDKINSRFDAVAKKTSDLQLLLSSHSEQTLRSFRTLHHGIKDKATVSPIWKVMRSVFGPYYALGGLCFLMYTLFTLSGPLILNEFISFINEEHPYPWKGYFYMALLFVMYLMKCICYQWFDYINTITGLRLRTAVIAMVYRKALTLNSQAKAEYTAGEIVNLMSVDSQKLQDAPLYLHYIWASVFTTALTTALMWQQLGAAVLAGCCFMLLTIPLNVIIVQQTLKCQVKQMQLKDERMKIANEVLKGIKVLKLYGWELAFRDRIIIVRNKELNTLWVESLWNAVHNVLFRFTPFLLGLLTFATYTLMSADNVLDANKAFVSIALFNILQVVLICIPPAFKCAAQIAVSIGRINSFMMSEELDSNNVLYNESVDDVITVENATFSWLGDTEPSLKNINMSVTEGKLVAVVGQVGAGKSSLISALLGDMEVIEGQVKTRGSIAYVPQQAWITNTTVQENILFGNFMNSITYKQVIDSCALSPDFQILTSGDLTEIGEHGINLSGGQKQRVSLARAVYQNSDVYLLDDPLSAVDAHVGKHIFDFVLGPNGMLKTKTRVLVTNAITFLPQTDLIICVKDGTISEIGSYEELLDSNGAFSEFIQNYQNDIKCKEMEEFFSGQTDNSMEKQAIKRHAQSVTRRKPNYVMRNISMFDESEDNSNRRDLTGVEGTQTGKIKLDVILNWFKSCGYLKIVFVFIFAILTIGFLMTSSIWLSEWTNDATMSNGSQDISQRDYRLGIYGLLGGFLLVCHICVSIVMALSALSSSTNLHHNLIVNLVRAPMAFFDTTPLGRIGNRISKDMEVVDTTIPITLRMLTGTTMFIANIFILISYSTPIFIIVMIPLFVFYIVLQQMYVSTGRQIMRIDSTRRSPIYSHFSESITGASSIRAYGQVERFIAKSDELVDQNQMAYFAYIASKRWLAFILDILGNTVVLCAGVFAVQARDTITPGIAGLSVSYALQLTMLLEVLTRSLSDLQSYLVSVERIHEYTDCQQEAPAIVEENQLSHDWPSKGSVTFDAYATRYRPGLDLVLKNISCEIVPGEHVGIVGRTGAGKSSITLALFRIIESASGRILIDGTNIASIGLQDLRSRITIIPQDPVLFSGTIRMNVDPLDKYSDREIWLALGSSHLKHYIKSLHGQLGYVCGEGGENFSVGQRQLVCLARALLRRSQILVLDEATAAVDLETDDLIQDTIRSEFKDSTVITIAHRLNTIMDYDRILVLNEGEIVELDKPGQLLQQKTSLFYDMARNAGLVS